MNGPSITIVELDGTYHAYPGDWIVKKVNEKNIATFYVVKQHNFEEQYEEA